MNAVLRAARRLTKHQVDAVLNGDPEKLWELMTTPPWVKPYIPHLHAEMKKRLDANPGIDLETVIADLDINFELEPGYIVVADLNGYSNFQNQATDHQKAILDKSYQKRMFELSDKFGVKMLQAPAGDAFIFHIEEDPAKLAEFLAELKNSKIKNPLKNADAAMYPDGNFTFSTGVAKNRAGELNMSLYTAAANLDHGLIDVGGAAFVRAIKLQQSVGKNQIGIDEETETDLREPRTITGKKEKTVHNLPKDDKEAVALMAALAKASHPRGSISTINRDLIEDLPNLGGITTIAIYAGNLEEIGKNPEAYKNISKKLLALRARFPNFFMFKKDEAKFHIHTNTELNEAGGKLIIDFCAEAARIVKEADLSCGIGVGYTETMVRTRILNSSIEERAGTGIVKAVRLATVPEKALRLDGEFCKAAFGNIFELESVKIDDIKAKGGDIPCVTIPIDRVTFETLEGKTLMGFEPEIAKINEFLDLIGKNGAAMKISSPGSGYGVSALIRHAMRYAKNNGIEVVNIERSGGGPYRLLRGFLKAFGGNTDVNGMDDEEVLRDFEAMLLNPGLFDTKRLLILDQKDLSDDERNLFEKLVSVLISTNTCLMHSKEFDCLYSSEMQVEELEPEDAAKLILKMNKKLDATMFLEPIIASLKHIKAEDGHPPLTPRNIIRIYAEALEHSGNIVVFNNEKLEQIQTGELTLKIKELDVSEERILILGMIAYTNIPLSAANLWSIYSADKCETEGFAEFLEDLQYLHDRGFINLDSETKEYSLKDKNEKGSAVSLAKSQIEESDLSTTVLTYGSFPENIEGMEAKLEHLLKGGTMANNKEIGELVGKIGRHFFAGGNLSAARKVYSQYLPLLTASVNEDLNLDIARAFHTGDKDQMRIAEEICRKSDTTMAKWLLSRLVKIKIKSNISEEMKEKAIMEMSEEEMNDYFKTGTLQQALHQISVTLDGDESINARLMKLELKIEDLYQRIKASRFFRYEKKTNYREWLERKNSELKNELESLIEEFSTQNFEGADKEMLSAAKVFIASSHYELFEWEKASTAFFEAGKAVDELAIPDYKQKIICLVGEVGTRAFLIQNKIEKENMPNERWRRMLDSEIDTLETRTKVLEENCILYGDTHYRAETFQVYADIIELRMRAITKFPILEDRSFDGDGQLAIAIANTEKFIKIRGIIGNPTQPGLEAAAKKLLHDARSELPKFEDL